MSLDVYLIVEEPITVSTGTGIFDRVNGQTKELTVEEVKQKWPDYEIKASEDTVETNEVFSANITHNLGTMASKVMVDDSTLYTYLWRPEEIDIFIAKALIVPLSKGLIELKSNPTGYKQFNPENGWGNYEQLVTFVGNYLKACIDYPDSKIEVSR